MILVNQFIYIYLTILQGERLQINLHGHGRESLVYLRDNKVSLNGTFIGLHSQTKAFIVNDSSDVISFKWSPFENSEEESLVNDLLVGTLNNSCDFKSFLKQKLITWARKFSDQQIVSSCQTYRSHNLICFRYTKILLYILLGIC